MTVLLVDQDRETLASMRRHLSDELDGRSVETVETGESALDRIDESGDAEDEPRYELVVSADELPGMDGLELLERVKDGPGPDVPFVLILGGAYEDAAMEAFGRGADRILRKDGDSDAEHRVLAKAIAEEVTRNGVRSSHRSTEGFREVLAESEEAILLIDDGTFVDCNEAAARMLGYDDCEEIVGRHPTAVSPPTQPDGEPSEEKADRVMELGAKGGYHRFEWLHRRADGEEVLLDVSLTPIIYEGERMLYCVWRAAGEGSVGEGQPADLTIDAPVADAAVSRGARIRALVIDGDGPRGGLLAHDVKRIAEEIEVTTVTTANEAVFSLDSSEEFDCLLVTTGVSEVDAVQLIEQVRENRPLFPTLLVTETPDRELVSRAIEAGVSDYVVRHPDGENATTVAEKIRATVAQARLQRDVESSVQRYRSLSEYLPDPTAFVQDGQVVFCNDRFVELTGRDRDRLRGDSIAETVVHHDDRERFDRALETWASESVGSGSEGERSVQEVRLARPDDTVGQCEVAGNRIDAEGLSGVLLSFRDVTDRNRRERELELERALIGTVQDALVGSQTRSRFEAAVLETLHERGYDLVCIGESVEGVLSQRTVRGDRSYVDAVDWSIGDGTGGTEPCRWAARTGTPQYVRDVEDLFPAAWREAALAAGHRGGAGIPLEYRGVTYGVLGVYVGTANRFDERERAVLERFADALAFAIHAIEVENALTIDAVSEVTMTVGAAGYYLTELAKDGAFVECGAVRVRGTVPRDETVIQYVTVDGGSLPAVREAIASHAAVTDVLVLDESDPVRLQVTATDPVPEARLAARGALVTGTRIDPSGATITLELPVEADPRSVADRLGDEFGSVEITASFDADRAPRTAGADRFRDANLTEKQATVLEAAYHHGYFERPRQHSATEVAESLGIAHSTFLQHLRAAEKKVFRQRFE